MPTVKANGVNIYYEVHGTGEPLVLSLGFFDVSGWAPQIKTLSQRFKVLIFDGRGVGRSDSPPPPYTTAQMADDTAALMDAVGFGSAHVLGFSLGGLVAQELAIKHPEKVRKLVLADTYSRTSNITIYRNDLLMNMLKEGVRPDLVFKSLFLWFFSGSFFKDDGQVDAFTNAFLNSPYPPPFHALEGQVGAIRAHDSSGRLGLIKAETLVMVGREDVIVPLREAEEMAAGIPNAALKVIDSAAHCFMIETPEKFTRAVLDFLG